MSYFQNLTSSINQSRIITNSFEDVDVKNEIKKNLDFFFKLGRKKLILIHTDNCKESVLGYLATLASNNTCMLVENNISDERLEKIINSYLPDFIFASERNTNLKSKYKIFATFENYNFYQTKFESSSLINDKLALMLTTSGSTGTPKFVRISYKNIEDNTNSIIKFLKINKKDLSITTMPMSYTYGLSIINTHIFSNASLFLNKSPIVSKDFWKVLNEFNITNLNFVPFLVRILQRLNFHEMKFKKLRLFTTAGGPLNKKLWSYLAEFSKKNKIEFVPMYGATEATSRMSYLPSKYVNKKIGSIGKGMKKTKLYLLDKKKNIINRAFVNGELIFEGSNVCLGYAQRKSDLSKNDENKCILSTNDIAYQDKDGFFFIIGRKDRFIKIYGHRVNLDEVEKILNNSGFNCACKGKTDCLSIYSDIKYDRTKLIKFISNKLNLNSSAFNYNFIKEIPKNENGKIKYSLL